MRKFNIMDKENKVLNFIKLDEEVAKVWNKPTNKSYFVNPFVSKNEIDDAALSWYEVFNTSISFPCSWENLKEALIEKYSSNFTAPFIALIDFWINKGYIIREEDRN